jgi:tight adherence protein C
MGLIVVLCGVVTVGAIAVAIAQLRPAAPALGPALRNLDPAESVVDREPAGAGRDWRRRACTAALPLMDRIEVPGEYLRLIGWSLERYALWRVCAPVAAVAGAVVVAAGARVIGVGVSATAAAGLVLGAAALGMIYPDRHVKRLAAQRRLEYRRAISAYIDLVALERIADTGPDPALELAAQDCDGRAFDEIRQAILTARTSKQAAWQGLRRLADDLSVVELGDVADIVGDAAQHGTAIADTLQKRAASLRDAVLTEAAAEAKAQSQRMWVPAGLLVAVFIGLVLYPVLTWIYTN